MPTLPPWAQGGRIIFDREHGLAFVRTERRGVWTAFATAWPVTGGRMTYLMQTHRVLATARQDVLKAIGDSIDVLVRACHPGARDVHLTTYYVAHVKPAACGAPRYIKQAAVVKEVTCALCLAVAAEDVAVQAQKVGHDQVEAARQVVVSTREANALGKIVTGEPATEHEL